MGKRFISIMMIVLLSIIADLSASDTRSVDARNYSKDGFNDTVIKAALESIGTSGKTLFLASGPWKINNSITIPSNVNLKLEPGAVFDIAESNTITINGNMEVNGLQKIFSGKGKVVFGPHYLKEVYPQWWGDVNSIDDTAICQAALDCGAKTIRFPAGTYAIDGFDETIDKDGNVTVYGGLKPASDTTLIFDIGAKLKAIPNDKIGYSILKIEGKNNVKIYGPTIEGERDSHTGTTGEYGMGIMLEGATNIVIKDANVYNCWGDGLLIGVHWTKPSDQIYVENSTFNNNRRLGCAVTNGTNILFKKCTFLNSNGTAPQAGVDIEPDKPTDCIQNIVFEDCTSYNNKAEGFLMCRDDGQNQPVSVTFRGCTSRNDNGGFGIYIGPSDTPGVLFINDCTVLDSKATGFRMTTANLPTKIDGLYVINPNQGKNEPAYGSGISITSRKWKAANGMRLEGEEHRLAGNITARNVNIFSDDGKGAYALFIDNFAGENGGLKNLDIELKTNMPNDKRFYKGNGPFENYCKVNFSDNPVYAAKTSIDVNSIQLYNGQKITNHGASDDIVLSFTNPLAKSLDSEYTIEVASPHKITLKCGNLLPGGADALWSQDIGSRIKIRSDGTNWHIVEQVGTWQKD
ncbi:MAG: hypothetical protein A2Y10_10575 [Planctomycetes bacterium GWF2_41_51]|nr:MAG: hypothetical protein A2Y10_10575 [Planctomycetes bacterium GWF2_41_51]HBG26920.1 hypothetical protein [Phycisphaerales bacterium]